MLNKIYELFPDIEKAINSGEISATKVLELNEELSTECQWCPYENGHCTVCGGIHQVVYGEITEIVKEDYAEIYKDDQAYIEYDEWANVINECPLHFYGICNGEESGTPCNEPSPYGCSYKK